MRFHLAGAVVCLFVITVCSAAFAKSDIGFYGIGGKLGFVMPEDPIESTFGLGIQADLGTVAKDVHLSALLDFWKKSYDEEVVVPGFTAASGEASFTEIVIGATAKYFFQTASQIEPYAGAGLGFTIGRSKWEATYQGVKHEGSHSDTDLGFHLLGGVEYPLSPTVNGIAEAKYHLDGADYFGIYVGVMYLLGK